MLNGNRQIIIRQSQIIKVYVYIFGFKMGINRQIDRQKVKQAERLKKDLMERQIKIQMYRHKDRQMDGQMVRHKARRCIDR